MKELTKQQMSYAEADRKRFANDIRHLLGQPEGRRVLLWLNSVTGVFAAQTMEHLEYQAGRRNVGIEILAAANLAAPELVLLATQERNEEQNTRNAVLRAADEKDRTNGH